MILVLNNRDSFVFNLARYFAQLGCDIRVVDSDRITLEEIGALSPRALVISPGPSTPAEAGVSLEVIRQLGSRLPILGVCLGHQAIAAAHGWQITRAGAPTHGRAVKVSHKGERLFRGLPAQFRIGLYHSLIAAAPDGEGELLVDAVSPSGEVMAVSHRSRPIYGIQFHPESILTEHGSALLGNFLHLSDLWRRS